VTRVTVRRAGPADRDAVERVVSERWGTPSIVSRGAVHDAREAGAFVAERSGDLVGVATVVVDGDDVELLTLDALVEGAGVGTMLVDCVVQTAAAVGARRVVVCTTNDNEHAVAFYRRRGFEVCAVRRGAVDRARERKPEIPAIGRCGIPVHDEIEMELLLTGP
jgi:N-acetylglutamate synthase-like GNAT family acetyltransferase